MRKFPRLFFFLAAALAIAPAYADQLVYVPLPQPCRLLDTRVGTGTGIPLSAGSLYLFGSDATSIANQYGNSGGCGIPVGVEAISVNLNMIGPTASGNIATWNADSGTTAPNSGTGVYNYAGQAQYNTGYTSIPVGATGGANPGKFYLKVANGQIDMTINIVGYWRPVSWGETVKSDSKAVAMGSGTTANGYGSTAMGYVTSASGLGSTSMGESTTASGYGSTSMGVLTYAGAPAGAPTTIPSVPGTAVAGEYTTAMGFGSVATGLVSTAMGYGATASGPHSIAMGNGTTAGGDSSTAMGINAAASATGSIAVGDYVTADGNYSFATGAAVSNNGHSHAFIFGDGSKVIGNQRDNEFMVLATGGFTFYTTTSGNGVTLAGSNGTWTSISDRNAKTAVQSIDARDVLTKVVTMPLNTWQYKTQDAKYRHMGPMAQDFYAAFHLGETDKGIDDIDAQGVALAAIQGVNAKLDESLAQLEESNSAKDREIAALRARVASLESVANDVAEMKAQLAAMRRSQTAATTVALQP